MKDWAKPTLVISKCLGETPCRYNGEVCTSADLKRIKPFVEIVEVCPEEGIGLPTPRNAIRLVGTKESYKLIDPKTMSDFTSSMVEFAGDMCLEFKNINPDGFILKSRSPSCGLKDVKIYSSCDKGAASVKGQGLFASILSQEFPSLSVEEDGRLKSFSIREHFLTKIFTLASFKEVKKSLSINKLIDFHTNNKLLFMSYNRIGQKTLGKIVANHENLNIDILLNKYESELMNQLIKPPKYTSIINALNHALGYFDTELEKPEKTFFFETIERFRIGKIPLSVPLNLLKSYSIRFKNDYLINQTFLEPYPEELVDINDSGKGIVRK